MISDINFIVIIDRLLSEDSYAIVNNQSNARDQDVNVRDPNDLGIYFDLINGEINHSIINLNVESKFTFTLNSKLETEFLNQLRVTNELYGNTGDGGTTNSLQRMQIFARTLVGRPISIFKYVGEQDRGQCVFYGYINADPGTINVQSGTQFTLVCSTILSQLSQISSNASWQDSTQKYGNIFSTISGNTVNYQELLKQIRVGSLSEDSDLIEDDGDARSMPQDVWAVILPNKDRLSVVKEILLPYSRIIYQKENGQIVVQPLFINDRADDIFNINCYNNYNDTWIGFNSRNAASRLPNRIDVLFGTTVPVNIFGGPIADNIPNAYVSTPKINKKTNKIESFKIEGVIDYASVYATSARLYNSGKFTMPLMITLSIDNSLVLDDGLLNSIMSLYSSKDFVYSNVYVSGDQKQNSVALLYSQIFMAQSNINSYNATITYDYSKIGNATSPLGKIVSIWNARNIDYHDMIIIGSSLSFGVDSGTLYTVDTAPLLSITGAWSTKDV